MTLKGTRVLVTGATGFIGGRLVEKLVMECGASVRVLVRSFARASRVARFAVEMIPGEVTDAEVLRRAAQDCEVVFHCAYGNRGNADEQRAVNVAGTETVARSVIAAGVSRMVHVSTISVYGQTEDGELDETGPRRRSGNLYAETKLEAEQLVLDYHHSQGLPVVVVQPTVVYGPFGFAWTINPLQELRTRRVVLIDEGQGLCNAVYVDDVVDALLLAATRPKAVGEVFLVSGSEPVKWKEFYGAYEQMLGASATINMTAEEARARAREEAEVERTRQEMLRRLGEHDFNASVSQAAQPFRVPSEHMVGFFAAKTRASIGKAQQLLGYQPRFDLQAGMRLTEAWARWAGLIPLD
jgi:nucleoside-diphosphate-sugar epimerase